ncbi:unnamed protein product [Linum tenue]|uniref:Aldehyde dehydrogenase 1 n=1 Tax=Linum tenue TaxID=586396 RepID=A0AAV0QG91_9ROSI|nr:unnamed protein product [Linum tenue]CAI0628956.1 unnamed protein product [Linum tenue]
MANHGSNGSSDDLTFPLEIPPAKIRFTKLFIGGEFVDSVSGKTFETIDPRTGETIARVSEGDKEDIDLAVGAARRAFDHGPWPRLPGAARAKIMHKFADLIDQHIEELATLDTLNAGKLFSWGKAVDIPSVANTLRYFAGAADKIHGQVLKMSRELHAYTLLEPIGVVGLIIPWNFPSTMFFVKVSPALAAGCTMVVKPAEQTPLSALFYAHLAKEAGIPDGVINVVSGYGPTAGAALTSHMNVDKVSFTGSTEVGRKVMQAAAASNLKTVSLELGGKSPLLIFDDADIDQAADLALLGVMHNKGEVCVAGSRVLVQEAIYDEFVKTLVEKAKEWVVGDPFHPNSRVGPQVDKKQYEKVMSYIEHGKREGATLLTGGKPAAKKGYYIEPTVFTDVTVSFTGSTEVGRKVMQAAALSNLKPVSLELGGKSPVLIFDDADVDKAVDLALLAIFYNKGEVCAAGSRVFVQEGIYDEFVKKLAVKAKEWTVGDPLDPTTRVGPQVNKTQFERVLSYIEHGKREGATLLTGGKPAAETGFYIQPTVFTDVKEDMMISRDEIFGPVMALMKFKTIEEGIKYANNTKYGLASGIVTKSLDIANTVSRSIKAGVVWINCYHGFDIDCPFGGYKMSGFGKDFGMEALHKYLQTKAVVTPIYNSPWL